MHLPLPGSAAARLRVATALAALSLLLPGCASPVPAPAGPAVVTPSVTDSATPVASVSVSPAAATSAPATSAPPAPPAAPPPVPAGNAATAGGSGGGGGCSADEYRNVDGVCVPRPTHAAAPPPGATAECKDGTYSFSKHHSGTCSSHGGVKRWL